MNHVSVECLIATLITFKYVYTMNKNILRGEFYHEKEVVT